MGELQSKIFWDVGFGYGKATYKKINIVNLVHNQHVSTWL